MQTGRKDKKWNRVKKCKNDLPYTSRVGTGKIHFPWPNRMTKENQYTTGQLVDGLQQKQKNRFSLNGNEIMSSFLGWQFYRSTL